MTVVHVTTGKYAWLGLIEQHLPAIKGKQASDKGWVSLNCPLHDDNGQHAGVKLTSGVYLCHNSTCQSTYLTALGRPGKSGIIAFVELLHLMYGWTVQEAQQVVEAYRTGHLDTLFAHDDNVSTNGTGKDTSTLSYFSVEIETLIKAAHTRLAEDFDDIEVAIDYAYSRGLSQEALFAAGVGYIEPNTTLPDGSYSGISGCLVFPYWFKNKLVGVRIRQEDSRKRMLRGSHYVPYNVNSVFETTSRTVIIAEGESDTVRLIQLLRDAEITNIPIVGTPGVSFDRSWVRFLQRFNRVVVVPQADAPSQDKFVGGIKAAFQSKTDVVQIPWEEDALGGKDVCDYLLMNQQHAADLIELLALSAYDIEDRPYIKTRTYFDTHKDRDIDWFIPNVIERGSKCLILGEPKVGKTFIVLDLINSAIHGTAFMNTPAWAPPTGGLKCLLIEEEGSENALTKRVLSIIPDTDLLGVIHGENIKLDDDASFTRLRHAVSGYKPDLIIFDPYASLHNQNENEVQGTAIVLDAINTIYRANPRCTVVVVHHTGVSGEKRARGSSALWGAMDSQIVVSKENTLTTLTIRGREIEDSDPYTFEFDPDTKRFTPTSASSITIVSHKTVDQDLAKRIIDALAQVAVPLTHKAIGDLVNADYNDVRTCLIALAKANQIARTGSGGRNGYVYALLPGSAP